MSTLGRSAAAFLTTASILATLIQSSQSQEETAAYPTPEPIRYVQTSVKGVPLKLVSVDLNDPNVKVTGMLARGGSGHSEPWSRMVDRARPTVAMTGTFFCTETLAPIGDLVIGGQLAHFGGLGAALCLTGENDAILRMPPRYRHIDWSGFDFVMRSGPTLVRHGKVSVRPRSEGFRDPSVLRPTGRLAVGITKQNRLLLAATRDPVSLNKMAWLMYHLDSRDAINLDAGSSMGLYVRGKTLIQPRRKLTNLLLVYEDRGRYESVRRHLAPATRSASSK